MVPVAVPDTPISYDDVEVLERLDFGFVCRIGDQQVAVGIYVPLEGTCVGHAGDRGRLVVPRWFAEQWGLPIPVIGA